MNSLIIHRAGWGLSYMVTSIFVVQHCHLVGKSAWNSAEFCNYFDSVPFSCQNFDRNFVFRIIKHVPAKSEHVPTVLEYFPAINSSNFMHQRKFLPFLFCLPRLHLLVFQWKQEDVILAGKAIASVFSEMLPDASVQTMPLRFDWGCRTFQTAPHVHVIHIWGVWAPSQVVNRHMASHSHHYHHRCFPRFVRVGWNPTRWKCANHATTLWLSL